jgi:hypothetical protein
MSQPMRLHPFLCATAAVVAAATPVSANDPTDACHAFGSAEVIFIGRVKSAPITRRISGEEDVERARVVMEAAEHDLKAYEALKMPPQIGGDQLRDLVVRMMRARDAFNQARAMHPPPYDVLLTPILVETAFRGVTTPELFMMDRGQPALDPARSYLFYADRPMGPSAPDVISASRPKELEAAEADLQFLHQVGADAGGAIVHGSLMLEDADDRRRRTPLAGVVLRISLDGQHYEISTGSDGTFVVSGVPPGILKIAPVLPDHLTLPPQSLGGKVNGGCRAINIPATLNGRIRGRVLLDSGEPFRGSVELLRHGHTRSLDRSDVFTNDRGEFEFSGVPPGDYLLGINVSRLPSRGAPFRPTYFPGTTDRASAVPVTVGHGTEHAEVDWAVSARLGEGVIEVTFDAAGQPQEDMGVCVTTYTSDDRPSGGGSGYERRSDTAVVIPVVEGIKYRFVAYASTPAGLARSGDFDFIGTPGSQSVRLPAISLRQNPNGHPCTTATSKPFSPTR